MKRGQFKINGQTSELTRSFITTRPQIQAAERVKDFRERPGGTSLLIDKQYYKNVPMSIDCYFKAPSLADVSHYQKLVSSWLDFGYYAPIDFYFDKHYLYQGTVVSGPHFKGTRKTGNLVPYSLNLELLPYKFNRFGLSKKEFVKELTIINPEKYPSRPEIHILGQGDISLSINNQRVTFNDVKNEIQLDCEEMECFKYDGGVLVNQSHLKHGKYPFLEVGENKIVLTGNVSKVELIPRWCTKI